MDLNEKYQKELEHDRKILADSEKVWGRSGKVGELRVARRARMIIDFCRMEKESRVLEIGCGTGVLTKYLADTGAEVLATDIFPEFLEIAKNRNDSKKLSLVVENAETLGGLKSEAFDAVCGLSILHHLDVEAAINSIKRVLKPGGFLAFSEPNMLNPQIAIQKNIPFIKKILGDSPDETAFFKWQIKNILKKNNFSEIEVFPFDFLHPALPDFSASVVVKIGEFLEKIPLIKEIAGSLFIGAKKIKGFYPGHGGSI